MAPRKKKDSATLTTAQSLGSLLKSARGIMRKDKGLNCDLNRLPPLTWVMGETVLDPACGTGGFLAERRQLQIGSLQGCEASLRRLRRP